MTVYMKRGQIDIYEPVPSSGGSSGCLLASIMLLTGFSGFVASVFFMVL